MRKITDLLSSKQVTQHFSFTFNGITDIITASTRQKRSLCVYISVSQPWYWRPTALHIFVLFLI